MDSNEMLASERFPRSAKYHPDWVLAGVSGGGNPLWMTEWLAEVLAVGRATGALCFVGSPPAKSAQVLITLAGALQVARVHDETPFQVIVGQLRLELLP